MLAITAICICLFIGAMGKSAQFPLHVWLPDSMEGPTPISALIHAATMVTAGIFMVTRMSPLFELSDTALSFVTIIGAITALFMGLLGVVQNDIKRVVAYSTLSQLGYMTVALGVSAYSVAVFHLMTHAFFKALLFLGAGSVIIGMHHDQDMRNMGGLRKYMPITWITSLIGSLALIGTPFFAGFYSKDAIIEAVDASQRGRAGLRLLRSHRRACSSPRSIRSACTSWSSTARSASATPPGRRRRRTRTTRATMADAWPRRPAGESVGDHRAAAAARDSSVYSGWAYIGPVLFGNFFGDSIADRSLAPGAWHPERGVAWAVGVRRTRIDHTAGLAGVGRDRDSVAALLPAPRPAGKDPRPAGLAVSAAGEQLLLRPVQRLVLRPRLSPHRRGLLRARRPLTHRRLLRQRQRSLGRPASALLRQIQSGYIYQYAFAMVLGVVAFLFWWLTLRFI